jgi:two-component system chemotaxis sensor kinase CheA
LTGDHKETDKYRRAFLEEAAELVAELESALLELDRDRGNPDVVGRAFRALHTIKGSGAMFGFDEIARFTHDIENAFDRLRTGELDVGSDLINLALAANDQIKTMLDEAAGLGTSDQSRALAILAELRLLTGTEEVRQVVSQAPVAEIVGAGPDREWRIRFRPGPDTLVNGTNPVLLFGELQQLGSLQVTADLSGLPPFRELDAERCYLGWDIVLTTAAPIEAIRDVFIFVEDNCELSIEPWTDAAAAEQALAQESAVTGPPAAAAAASVRVSAEKLDQLINLVGELVTVQARMSELAARKDDPEITSVSEEIERLTAGLRDNSISVRMLPLKNTFERFRRLVHDLGAELHKDVELSIAGAETELDKTVIDQLSDPLVHLIRNSMDHGIETAEARRAAGKPSTARISLAAVHSGANVLIRVSDDGRGLNAESIRSRAVEKGLIDSAARLSESELFSLILMPGFSTATAITDLSGRGVGMDVVRRNVEALHGSIEIQSQPGAGMSVTLRLPLTLAIIDGLLIRVGQAHFVLPLANSLECVELTQQDVRDAHGKHIANVRGEMIPYIRLSEYFRMDTTRPEREQIMVVETEHGRYGFVVDQVLGDHQTVIKNLGKLYRNVPAVSGATILGNGTVALILDPHRLVQNAVQTCSPGRHPHIHERSHSKGRKTNATY